MTKDLISINDLALEEIHGLLKLAAVVEEMPLKDKVNLLRGNVLGVMFFEPSTRTRLSFEAAMARLGGSVIGFSETGSTSVAKGESLSDTVRTLECYSDIMVIRHPKEGAARLAADVSEVPVINAGDGSNQHPSQTLLDLYTLQKFFGKVSGLKVAFCGDLKYGRTVHSLVHALMMFRDVEITLVSPEALRLPDYLKIEASNRGITLKETMDLSHAIASCDALYMTRIQKERFADLVEYDKVKNSFCLTAGALVQAQPHMKVLHPLPRVNEIACDVDQTRHAGYFEQVRNGVIMRQAVLLTLLGVQP